LPFVLATLRESTVEVCHIKSSTRPASTNTSCRRGMSLASLVTLQNSLVMLGCYSTLALAVRNRAQQVTVIKFLHGCLPSDCFPSKRLLQQPPNGHRRNCKIMLSRLHVYLKGSLSCSVAISHC
jgi:hypothetical protein